MARRPPAVRSALRWLPGLLVMPLRAAEQHVLVVVGEADMDTADQLRSHLTDALSGSPASLVVDLVGLDFCDLHGLDALYDAARRARDAGVPLTVRGMSPQLAWLHATCPPADPELSLQPPDQPPAAGAGVDGAAAAGTEQSPSDAPASADAAGAAPPDPGTAARALPLHTAFLPVVEPHRRRAQTDAAVVAGTFGAARGTGAASEVLHAVPLSDTTRSAACGVRVRRTAGRSWDEGHPAACPDCTALLARTAPPGDQGPPAVRRNALRTPAPRPAARRPTAPQSERAPGLRRAHPPGRLLSRDDGHQHPDPAA